MEEKTSMYESFADMIKHFFVTQKTAVSIFVGVL